MAGGRPTKYENEVTLKKTEEYILNGFLQAGDVIPTKEGLSEYLGVACSTIELWAEKHEEFSGSFIHIIMRKSSKNRISNYYNNFCVRIKFIQLLRY